MRTYTQHLEEIKGAKNKMCIFLNLCFSIQCYSPLLETMLTLWVCVPLPLSMAVHNRM